MSHIFIFSGLSLLAGMLSITSPCTLPLLPGYIAFVTARTDSTKSSSRVGPMVFFIIGFITLFTLLGAAATGLVSLSGSFKPILDRISALIILIFGIILLFGIRLPLLEREFRPLLSNPGTAKLGAFALGVAFGAGWTPCVGPVLASVLLLASQSSTAGEGAILLLLYAVGMGIAFFIFGVWAETVKPVTKWLKHHASMVNTVAGLLLCTMGILLFANIWQQLMAPLLGLYASLHWPPI